jgi:hypothetical protein
MSNGKAANSTLTKQSGAGPDADTRLQKGGPGQTHATANERLPKSQTGTGDKDGKGVDETGKDSKAPHTVK